MKYKVCITTAGVDFNLNSLTKNYNKALISLDNKPIISHIINSFDSKIEFVIALGSLGDQVRSYLKLAHPKNKFNFVYIDKFLNQGSGYSLLKCKKHLLTPFIHTTCDSYFLGKLPKPSYNWMGYSESPDIKNYRSINIKYNKIYTINDKARHNTHSKAYIGISGIYNYDLFWKNMNKNIKKTIKTGEIQGLNLLLTKEEILPRKINWNDIGTLDNLKKTRAKYKSKNKFNILEKENEAIWFVNNHVIKQSIDKKFISERIKRCKILGNYVPKIIAHNQHMYKYKMVNGNIFTEINDIKQFENLLIYSKKFWSKKDLSKKKLIEFQLNCKSFYKNKTIKRINLFLKKYSKIDNIKSINGSKNFPIKKILKLIDWEYISKGAPSRFHGDFHFENILLDKKNKFIFLDWRQNFSDNLYVGDVYYDLAKLMHGLIISHKIIVKNLYEVNLYKDFATYNFHRLQTNINYEKIFSRWIIKNNYDLKKVYIITALIFLNIAVLHHHPYSILLFLLGKVMLIEILNL